MIRMMLRPRWLLALVLVLLIAAGFALLAQWQVSRAVESSVVPQRATEELVVLDQAAKPDLPTKQAATGQRVTVSGSYVPGDTVIVGGRLQSINKSATDSETGFWVVAHFEVSGAAPGGLPIALGWAATHSKAAQARADFEAQLANVSGESPLLSVQGRFLPSEAPAVPEPHGNPLSMKTVAVAQLINLWKSYDGPVYFGYLTASTPPVGLVAISSPPPEQQVELNWLNVFYALEWVVFAAFALYIWVRLVKDALQREAETALETG